MVKQTATAKETKHEVALREIYHTVVTYKSQHDGMSPTLRLLANLCGISIDTTAKRVQELCDRGLLTQHPDPYGWLQIQVVGGKWTAPHPCPAPLCGGPGYPWPCCSEHGEPHPFLAKLDVALKDALEPEDGVFVVPGQAPQKGHE